MIGERSDLLFARDSRLPEVLLYDEGTVHTHAPVAQLDRALASGARGRRFESCRAYHCRPGLVWPGAGPACLSMRRSLTHQAIQRLVPEGAEVVGVSRQPRNHRSMRASRLPSALAPRLSLCHLRLRQLGVSYNTALEREAQTYANYARSGQQPASTSCDCAGRGSTFVAAIPLSGTPLNTHDCRQPRRTDETVCTVGGGELCEDAGISLRRTCTGLWWSQRAVRAMESACPDQRAETRYGERTAQYSFRQDLTKDKWER